MCDGDLIDKGSNSKECLLTINYLFSGFEKLKQWQLEQQNPIIYIAGNHELDCEMFKDDHLYENTYNIL